MKISDINQDNSLIQYIQQNGKAGPRIGIPFFTGPEPDSRGRHGGHFRQSREMNKIHEVLATTPDVRAEKVAALKQQVESGQYQVNSDAVADKMLKEFLFDLNR